MKIRSSRSFYLAIWSNIIKFVTVGPNRLSYFTRKAVSPLYLSLARAEKKAKLPRPMDKHRRSGLRKHGSIRTMLAFSIFSVAFVINE